MWIIHILLVLISHLYEQKRIYVTDFTLHDSLAECNVCIKYFLFSHHQTYLQSREITIIRNLSQSRVKQFFFFFF